MAVLTLPEHRERNLLTLQPVPIIWSPPSGIGVAAGLDEFHKLFVRHVEAIHLERRDIHRERRELVVPAEGVWVMLGAERRRPGRYADPLLMHRLPVGGRRIAHGRMLLLEGQAMPHV